VIPGSKKNEAHIRDNINIFDFTLTDEEVASINAISKNTPYYVSTAEALASYLAFAPDFDGQE
jgi:diketogulonate reductase-like aldo/keto reductase